MISEAYQALNRQYATAKPSWATGGMRHRETVLELIREHNVKTVLDYGCGRGTLGNSIMGRDKHHAPVSGVTWYDYDPAAYAEGLRKLPKVDHVDLITCTHVLEHVEPELLDATLEEFKQFSPKVIYIAVPSGPAKAVLPDGRNAHLIQESGKWWEKKLRSILGGRIKVLRRANGDYRDETRFVVTAE